MSNWKKICLVQDIPVLDARCVTREKGMDVAAFRNDQDEVFALLDRCPHRGGPLSQGIVFGSSVACPLHNWTIRLTDGTARAPDELASHALGLSPPVAGPGCKKHHALAST